MKPRDKQLRRLESKLPTIECQGKCTDYCGPVGMSPAEAARMREAGHEPPNVNVMLRTGCVTCPLLKDGRCSAYNVRPLVCRLWGVALGMECPHGCKRSGPLLTKNQGFALLDAADRISL